MCCTQQLNNAEDFPPWFLEFLSSCWVGRISLVLRRHGEKWCGSWASALIPGDSSLLCSWNCSEPPCLHSMCQHSQLCTHIMQAKCSRLMLILSLFEAKEAPKSPQGKYECCPQLPGFTATPTLLLLLGEHRLGQGASSSPYKKWRKLSYSLLLSKTWV